MPETRCVRTHCRALFAVLSCLLALGGWLIATPAGPVSAAPLHVTSCLDDGGATTLRNLIGAAAAGDTIDFNQDCTITLAAASGTLTLAKNVTIDGTGHAVVVDGGCTLNCGTINAGNGVRVFLVNAGVTATLNALTIRRGNTASFGGGILNGGALTVANCTFSENGATGAFGGLGGGGIANGGNGILTVTDSAFTDNSTTNGNGGGIYNQNGTATVTGSTFTGNSATGNGGGIFNTSGTLTVARSSFIANSTNLNNGGPNYGYGGGGIYNIAGMMTVTNSTFFANNGGYAGGGGIWNFVGGTATVTNSTVAGNTKGGLGNNGTLTVTNTIVATNFATSGPNLFGTFTSGGHNLFGTTSGATIILGSGDMVNLNPLLGPLSSNGGPTQTLPLLTGSPAIAHGDPAVCNLQGAGKVDRLDQRGVVRPTTLCAIGAFEPLLSAINPNFGSPAGGTTVTVTGSNFVAGGTVISIGGVTCASVQVASSTTLTCTTGAHAAGAVDVVGASAVANQPPGTLPDGFTYGVLTPLPLGRSVGPVQAGTPNVVPGSRSGGVTGGPAPNPLPPGRP